MLKTRIDVKKRVPNNLTILACPLSQGVETKILRHNGQVISYVFLKECIYFIVDCIDTSLPS